MHKKFLAALATIAFLVATLFAGTQTAQAAPKHLTKSISIQLATPANDGTFGQTKYVYWDSTHRFGAYAQMTFDTNSSGQRVARGEYVSAWTEVKQSDGSWARVRLCLGQDFSFRYSIRKSDGNHPTPMDYFNDDLNVAYGNYNPGNTTLWPMNQYTMSLHAGYSVDGSCAYPWYVSKDASFYAHQY